MHWFGPSPWGSQFCLPETRVPCPVALCDLCQVEFQATDSGYLMPVVGDPGPDDPVFLAYHAACYTGLMTPLG